MKNLFLVFRRFPDFKVRKTSLNHAGDLATPERFLFDMFEGAPKTPEMIAPDEELFILEFDIDIQREHILACSIEEDGGRITAHPFFLGLEGIKGSRFSKKRKWKK